MSGFERRLDRAEMAISGPPSEELGVLFVPRGMSPSDQAGWLASLPKYTGSGSGVIVLPHKGNT